MTKRKKHIIAIVGSITLILLYGLFKPYIETNQNLSLIITGIAMIMTCILVYFAGSVK